MPVLQERPLQALCYVKYISHQSTNGHDYIYMHNIEESHVEVENTILWWWLPGTRQKELSWSVCTQSCILQDEEALKMDGGEVSCMICGYNAKNG